MKRNDDLPRAGVRSKLPELLFFLGLFLLLFAFYAWLHPLVLLSLDDWAYFGYARIAVPSPTFWNPSRVLPETLMPLCGSFAALLYHIGGDYVKAQVFALALVYALGIAAYVFCFYHLLRKKLSLERFSAMLLSGCFLLLHFLIFCSQESNNLYLFHVTDVVLIFYYSIPAMLNAALLMLDLAEDFLPDLLRPGKLPQKAALVLALYLAVFSNLFASVLFAVYVGCRLLTAIPAARKAGQKPAAFLRAQLCRVLVLLLWLVSALFEALGGRASGSSGAWRSLGGRLAETLGWFSQLCEKLSWVFLALAAAGLLFALALLCLRRLDAARHEGLLRPLGLFGAVGLLCLAFLLLLCAVVDPAYSLQPLATLPFFFMLLLFLCWCAGYALSRWKRLALLLPIALLVILSASNTRSRTYADCNCLDLSSQTCMEINYDLLEQVRQAEEAGQREITLKTLDSGEPHDNWPHSTLHLGQVLADLFYKHGVVSEPVTITIEPSQDFNRAHGLHFGA